MLTKSFSTSKIFIKNKELPICLNCFHFIEHINNYSYDELPSDKLNGRFKKFGQVDLVTGLIEYDFVKNCRNDTKKCGELGYEYKDKMKD
jgi:hypothetical protein